MIHTQAYDLSVWSSHRAGMGRAGYSNQRLSFSQTQTWQRNLSVPTPAWTSPAKRSYWQKLDEIQPRVTDDWVNHVVADAKFVWLGSSTDDTIRCLNLTTGMEEWSFVTDGPVRYAPVLVGELLFFGSDDGHVYCVNAKNGQLLWRKHLGPRDWRIPGNGRMISLWPVRTGLVEKNGVIYATAGLYPSQGVYATALRVIDGSVVWRQQLNVSPQGYLLSSETMIFVPTGRGNPVALDSGTGRLVKSFNGVGGTFAVLIDNELFSGPGNDGSLTNHKLRPQGKLASFKGKAMAASPSHSFLLDKNGVRSIDRLEYRKAGIDANSTTKQIDLLKRELNKKGLSLNRRAFLQRQLGKLGDSLDTAKRKRIAAVKWSIKVLDRSQIIALANCIVLGGSGFVEARSLVDGSVQWSANVKGTARGLAYSAGRLLVSTDTGSLYCFSNLPAKVKIASQKNEQKKLAPLNLAKRLAELARTKHGWALVTDLVDGSLCASLAEKTQLNIIGVSDDLQKVTLARKNLAKYGVYGNRVSISFISSDKFPFTDYFANLIVSEGALLGKNKSHLASDEWKRMLQPYNGVVWLHPDEKPYISKGLAGAGEWTHQYGNPANTSNSGDTLVQSDLVLQWFGGPGAAPMVDRHLRAPAPLAAKGKLIIPGENILITLDAYNGTELWRLPLPDSQRYSMPYDAGYMSVNESQLCVAVKDSVQIINLDRGKVTQTYPVSIFVPGEKRHWGYTALLDNRLYGTAQLVTASRTQPDRELISTDYNNNQPLVTSTHLFSAPLEGTRLAKGRWTYEGGTILNPTITLSQGCVFFVETTKSINGTGQHSLEILQENDLRIVCLDSKTGGKLWSRPLQNGLEQCRNILFVAASGENLVVTGSHLDSDNDTLYRVNCYSSKTGDELWRASHLKGLPGAFTHGEQVHHPVILGERLIAEPAIYELATGKRLGPMGEATGWNLKRPGHSCGTLTGAGDCLFFRAANPTVLDLGKSKTGEFQSLSPTRPGCWINILPAQGLVLIPEASSGCVCHFSLQTSMAFRPRRELEQ